MNFYEQNFLIHSVSRVWERGKGKKVLIETLMIR